MITSKDMKIQVERSIGESGEPVNGFDVDGIVDTIQARYGTVHIDAVEEQEYWRIVADHELVEGF